MNPTLLTGINKINPYAIYNVRRDLENLRDTFQREAQEKKVNLSLRIEEDLPVAYYDMHSLRKHVFDRILSNALSHTQAEDKIAIRAEKADEHTMLIQISTTCTCPSPEERRNIFFRSPTSKDEMTHNVLSCIQAHKGTLDIVNEVAPSGITCKIMLPLYALCMR
jgi:K+-sensing histidine kinase KdpD